MGWTFHPGTTRADIVRYLLTAGVAPYQVLDHSRDGNTLWAVLRHPERDEPPFIICALLRGDRNFGWGYKEMDESMGPAEVNCPLRLLRLAPLAAGPYAESWRERVRTYHAERNAQQRRARALRPGQRFALRGARQAWAEFQRYDKEGRILATCPDGGLYRIPKRMIGEVLPATCPAAAPLSASTPL